MADPYDVLKLENQLCFPLYACAREIVKMYKPYLDEFGLTYTQYITLLVLWEHQQISVKELGRFLYLDSGTLTPVLKKLEQKGLILRKRDRQDERVLRVSLTPQGLELRKKAVAIPSKMCTCMQLDPEEAEVMNRLLRKMLNTNFNH